MYGTKPLLAQWSGKVKKYSKGEEFWYKKNGPDKEKGKKIEFTRNTIVCASWLEEDSWEKFASQLTSTNAHFSSVLYSEFPLRIYFNEVLWKSKRTRSYNKTL